MALSLRLNRKILVRGLIVARTGLSIGGTDTGLGISGADRVVVRDPLSHQPYIPGSSLKGRMRSLVERAAGEFGPTPGGIGGGPIRNPESDAAKALCALYGQPADEKAAVPARISVRDARLANAAKLAASRDLDLPFTELKTEVTVDRITAKATPHHYERVPAGAVFGLDIVVSAYKISNDGKDADDDEAALLGQLFAGLRLVQDDTLGACGSRGYGKVAFHLEPLTARDAASYISGAPAAAYSTVAVPDDLKLSAADVAALGL